MGRLLPGSGTPRARLPNAAAGSIEFDVLEHDGPSTKGRRASSGLPRPAGDGATPSTPSASTAGAELRGEATTASDGCGRSSVKQTGGGGKNKICAPPQRSSEGKSPPEGGPPAIPARSQREDNSCRTTPRFYAHGNDANSISSSIRYDSAHGGNTNSPRFDVGHVARQTKDVSVTLRADPWSLPGAPVDPVLHLSVLKALVGEELRELVCEEVRALMRQELQLALAAHAEALTLPRREQAFEEELCDVTGQPPAATDARSAFVVAEANQLDKRTAGRVQSSRSEMDEEEDLSMHLGLHDIRSFGASIADNVPCIGRLALNLERRVSALGTAEAPPRADLVSRLADSEAMAFLSNAVIVLNCAFMVHAANEQIKNYKNSPAPVIVLSEYVFLGFYVFEFIIKMYRHRAYYFYNADWKYNWLDFSILFICCMFLGWGDSAPHVPWLRSLRILKLAKALRVLRVISMFKPIRAILASLSSTLSTFLWSIIMLAGFLFMFALIFVLRTANHFQLRGESLDPAEKGDLEAAFGTVATAMLSLFMAITGGNDWSVYYDALLPTGFLDPALFLVFVAFAQMAVMNIILGIFVDHAMKSMLSEKKEAAREHADEWWQQVQDLHAFCKEANVSGTGRMTQSEWHDAVVKGEMSSYLDLMGFRGADVTDYFRSLASDQPDGTVDIETFVTGCMRLKGSASCFDMYNVRIQLEELKCSVKEQQCALRSHLDLLQRRRSTRSPRSVCDPSPSPSPTKSL